LKVRKYFGPLPDGRDLGWTELSTPGAKEEEMVVDGWMDGLSRAGTFTCRWCSSRRIQSKSESTETQGGKGALELDRLGLHPIGIVTGIWKAGGRPEFPERDA
jgi:hypothetical protein